MGYNLFWVRQARKDILVAFAALSVITFVVIAINSNKVQA